MNIEGGLTMKGYLFISEKNGKVNSSESDIQDILRIYNGLSNVQVRKVLQKDSQCALFTFTNEPNNVNYSYGRYEFATSGEFLYEEQKVFGELLRSKDQDQYIANLGGINTLALLDENNFTLWNNVTRVEPIYWAETKDRIVVGTRAILVHLLAYDTRTPVYDPLAMGSFLNNGFYADEQTPFKGLNILEINRKLQVCENQIKINEIDNFEEKLYTLEPNEQVYDELTQSYLDSFLFLKKLGLPLTIGLTGGKDSRLIAAGLNYLKIDFKTQTNGFLTSPDVVVAEKIARQLNIEHKVRTPAGSKDVIKFDLFQRTINTIKNTEGMVYAYENVSGIPKEFNPKNIMLGGQGGAFIKGGYSKAFKINKNESLETFMIRAFIKHQEFFESDAIERYKDFVQEKLLNESLRLGKEGILNRFYLTHRGGRWTSCSRPYYTARGYTYSPLFENQLVKHVQMIDTEFGKNDEIIYNILQRIAPDLIDIPFADDRWDFEKHHPYHENVLKQWIERRPVQATSKLSGFNWRKNLLKTSKKQLEEVILGNESSLLFDVVKIEKVKELFTGKVRTPSDYDSLLWSMYTGSVLLSNDWYNDTERKSPISIKVPTKTTKKVSGIIEEIRHIPNNVLSSKNENLKLQNLNDITSLIKWNIIPESVMYFQAFDGVFTTPPKSYVSYSKVKGKKAKFNFEIEKISPGTFELDVFFIQYNKEKRIKSGVESFNINEKKKIYTLEIPIVSAATDYKIAFRIKENSIPNEFFVKQMRIEFLS